MVVEPLKKLAIGDMPPSPIISNPISSNSNTHKKPTRHHYKRRSSGRVHVTKLTPMAKAHTQQQLAIENGNECNNDDDDKDGPFEDVNQQPQRHQQLASRKPMKRTQSNKSIHRLSSFDPQRKVNLSGFIMTSKPATSSSSQSILHVSPPMTPTDQQQFQQTQPDPSTKESIYAPNRDHTDSAVTAAPPTERSTRKPKFTTSPSFQVSHQAAAAPIANTLNATANTLVAPDRPALANLTTSTHIALSSLVTTSITIAASHDDNNNKTVSKSRHLCSRFVRQDAAHSQHFPPTITNNDIFSADHMIPNIMNIFTFGDLENEYKYIQTYQDPMVQSLARCMKQRQQQQRHKLTTRPTQQSTQSQLQRLAQRGAQQRTFSSSILPTMSTLTSLSSSSSPAPGELTLRRSPSQDSKQQYPEHSTLARQRYRRLQAVYASSSSSSSSMHHHHSSPITTLETKRQPPSRWSAGSLLGRVFSGTP